MLLIKLAFRNITHAGMKIWLNVIVLSFAFVAIVFTEGLYDGMSEQVRDAEINSNVGGGQFWQVNYDPYDPFSLETAHSVIPVGLQEEIENGNASPILIVSASIFPRYHIKTIYLKGIDPGQKTVNLPSSILKDRNNSNSIPGFIGSRMAESTGLREGDFVSARWRNINGTFDAGDIEIIKVIDIVTPLTDREQIWVPLEKLRSMMLAPGQATIVTLNKGIKKIPADESGWIFKDSDSLLKDLNDNVNRKKIYSSFMYAILLSMALLAVFDTQVLAIFKRRKEMGTLMALGMTRLNIILLFALEGCITGILAFFAGSLYGIPLLAYFSDTGIILPGMVQQSQFALGLTLYPKYGLGLYLATALILFVSVIIVSFLPTRTITRLKPTDALRGKM